VSDFNFLFRQDKGRIDRFTWLKGFAGLCFVWLAFFALYAAVSHFSISGFSINEATQLVLHDAEGNAEKLHALGDGSMLIFPTTLLMVVSFIVGVCFYFLSAKRFQDLGITGNMALVLPVLILFDAALHWMQPRLGANFPWALTFIFDGVTLGMAAWSFWWLGFKERAGR